MSRLLLSILLMLARRCGFVCTTELPVTPVFTDADAEAPHTILSNLISNAVRYATRHVYTRLQPTQKQTTYIIVEMCSDRPVVPADIGENILNRFTGFKEAAKNTGTAFGLALAKLHHGLLYMKEAGAG